jgi:hypothetical protein
VFESVLRRCIEERLVGGEGFAVDASLIKADADRQIRITDLRLAAEKRYRSCAHFADDAAEKIRWIDLANRVRPVNLF